MSENKINLPDQILENAPCGYLQIDTAGAILRINNTLRRWLGYGEKEAFDMRSIENLFSAGGKIYCQTHLYPILQMQGEVSEINLTLKGRNTITFPTLVNVKKDTHEPDDTIQTYSVFIIDITQRKMYERELLIARKSAEEASQKLREVNMDLEQFAYTASHDLQSPLRTISGMVNLLEKKKLIKPDSEEEKLFSLIKSNTDQMRSMVRDLLAYSKVDDSDLKFIHVPIGEVCEQAIELIKADVETHQAVFHISKMPTVLGSKSQLLRLFQNLFENSIKYRSDETPHIVVTHHMTENNYHIHVKDNGIGFEMENATKIFSFMKRLSNGEDIPGTGIGLTACKRIMKNHKGSIIAESEPGKGSVFKLQFPWNTLVQIPSN